MIIIILEILSVYSIWPCYQAIKYINQSMTNDHKQFNLYIYITHIILNLSVLHLYANLNLSGDVRGFGLWWAFGDYVHM